MNVLRRYKRMCKQFLSKEKKEDKKKIKKRPTKTLKERLTQNKLYYRAKNVTMWIVDRVLNTPIDFVFVFFASFLLTHSYEVWERLLFSIGISYIAYKLKELFMIYLSVAYRGTMK